MTNCYLCHQEGTDKGIIIDPGADADKIAAACRQAGVSPTLAVNTHAHYDHIGANAALKNLYPGLRFAIGTLDADSLSDPEQNLSAGFGVNAEVPAAELQLDDGDTVNQNACDFRIHHTPGHTRGSVSLVSSGEQPWVVFCGDLLFADGVGRTDLPGGNSKQLRDSIEELLSSIPDDAILYPGHGPAVTVKERKAVTGL